MPSEMQVFKAAGLSLEKGVNLVEASAGTGKTFAIAMLALRFVAELAIPVDRLLVVTFTKAAAEELKMRIRARFSQARDLLAGIHDASDPTLAEWAAGREGDAALMLERLQLALYDIDRAGIFTIHSFCQRMLQEQALESGQLFDAELLADIEAIRTQAIDDFWRKQVYGLAPLPCSILLCSFPTPESLADGIKPETTAARIEPEGVEIAPALALLDAAFARLADWWQKNGAALYPFFLKGIEDKVFNKEFSTGFEANWQKLAALLEGTSQEEPGVPSLLARDSLIDALNGNKLRGEQKKRDYLAGWPLPETEAADFLQAQEGLQLAFRLALARTLADEVQARLEQKGAMSFNDLILRLSRALGEGSQLKTGLAERYQVVLIDEFQDTDQAQWHIFSTAFGGGNHYLYLIGDPKQAVYRFRGADIFSYFAARDSATARLTLDKNYRSHPDLVAEVNRLFGSRPQPFGFQSMDFQPVAPARSPEQGGLTQHDRPWPVVIYCQLPEMEKGDGRWTSGRADECILQFVLSEAARMLAPGDPLLLVDQDDGPRPVRPRDIGILVRSNKQAEQYRQAFALARIPAVVASRLSVFDTAACREMFLLLAAIAAPGDLQRLKAAMTLPWFGLSGAALVEIWQDDVRIEAWMNRFQAAFRLWQEQGFMTMMNRLLVDEGVLTTLAPQRLAERHIANIFHLMELIQAAESGGYLSPGRTLQWLQTMMAEGGKDVEDTELRLESDEEAVRIVTMHSAKGLEYPIVFCPLLWGRSTRPQQDKGPVSCHEPGIGPVLDLGSSKIEERRQRAAEEELFEELRLLYVAVTRARLSLYIFWADGKKSSWRSDSFSSGLGYLLFPDGPADFHGQQTVLQSFARGASVAYRLVGDETQAPGDGRPAVEMADTLAARQPSERSLRTDWQMSSYSAMAALSEYDDDDFRPEKAADDPTGIPCPGLPAGAGFGNVVHGILESVPFAAIAAGRDTGAEQQCRRYGVKADPQGLQRLLQNVVTTPLPAAEGFSLCTLKEERCLREMPFYFHPDRIDTAAINAVLAKEATVRPLARKEMRGYLTGFVDLFCEWDGRYYILDYKTNYLGEFLADYAPDKLVRAMEGHNYGLQYWIYTAVLHRHLQNILPGYRYERDFGGVLYLFVRGMVPTRPGSGIFFVRPDTGILDRLCKCLGTGI